MNELYPFLDDGDAEIYATYKLALLAKRPLRDAAEQLGIPFARFVNKCYLFRALERIHNGEFTIDKYDAIIIDGVSMGLPDAEVAKLVYRSEDWVTKRITLLRRHLGARNRAVLVRRAFELGILPLGEEVEGDS